MTLENRQVLEDLMGRLDRTDLPVDELKSLAALLRESGTFHFPILDNGLYPAAAIRADNEYTGYGNVWVRDNVQIAHARQIAGDGSLSGLTAQSLMRHFTSQRPRFQGIIDGTLDASDPANRPHVRFDGLGMRDLPERWPHAQNDALGYFLWFYCRLVHAGVVVPSQCGWQTLGLFPRYFETIRFWEDEDSGHWEEERKVSASSIGVVLGGLLELKRMAAALPPDQRGGVTGGDGLLERLLHKGRGTLDAILPHESRHPAEKARRYDSALLFLIHPVGVVPPAGPQADCIIRDVGAHLQGEIGIRRYLGDSFWAPDYKKKLEAGKRTVDWSDGLETRNRLAVAGGEAQWCIFDPILSSIHGLRYRLRGDREDLVAQMRHLGRSLRQLTGSDGRFPPLRCPELYSLEERTWQPNDVTPLLWTQANLLAALKDMAASLETPAPSGESVDGSENGARQ